MGYASVKNTMNFTNEDLLEKLSSVEVSFGKPEMGDIKGTQAVMYRNVGGKYDVFVRINKKDVIMGKLAAGGAGGMKSAMGMGLDMFLGHKDEETSIADRAVDELLEIVKKLESGETVTQSQQVSVVSNSGENETALFMKQKAISIKPKFDVFDENETVVYHVEGDVTRLNFSIQKSGNEVLKLKKKMIPVMTEYTILQGGSEIGKIKKKLKLTRPELTGTVNGKELRIVGDLMGFDFDIQIGGATIGHVDTARTVWSDCYRIRTLDASQQDLVVALAIICDNIADQQNDNN